MHKYLKSLHYANSRKSMTIVCLVAICVITDYLLGIICSIMVVIRGMINERTVTLV